MKGLKILLLLMALIIVNPALAEKNSEKPCEKKLTDKIPSFILPKSFLKDEPCLDVESKNDYSDYIRLYEKDYSKLIVAIITSLSQTNYKIQEINTDKGYIVFSISSGKKFIIAIKSTNLEKNYVKIMPYNSKYDFPSEIVTLLFDKIDLTLEDKSKDKKIKK